MGDTDVPDIVSRVEVRATPVGDDPEEGGASRSWGTGHENHLAQSQDTRVPGRKSEGKKNIHHMGDLLANDFSNGCRL